MKAVWYLVSMEVAIFCFTIGVSIYQLTLNTPEGKELRAMQRFHTLVTLILIYMAVDHRSYARGYIAAFVIVLVTDLLTAMEFQLYMGNVKAIHMKGYVLESVSLWLNVASTIIVIIWYVYEVFISGKKNADEKVAGRYAFHKF